MTTTELERPRSRSTSHPTHAVPVTTRSGETAWLAPLTPGDQGPLHEVFDGLSDMSRFYRFMVATPRLSAGAARHLARVDQRCHVAIVAGAGDPAHGRGGATGIGRYIEDPHRPWLAEVALAVVDERHGRGIGRLLLGALGAVAARRGVTHFSYVVHPHNTACLALLESSGATFVADDGTLAGLGRLPTGGIPSGAAAALSGLVEHHDVMHREQAPARCG